MERSACSVREGGWSVGAPRSQSPWHFDGIPMAGREGPGRGRPASGRYCRVHTVPLGLPKAQDSMVRQWAPAPHNLATTRCALRVVLRMIQVVTVVMRVLISTLCLVGMHRSELYSRLVLCRYSLRGLCWIEDWEAATRRAGLFFDGVGLGKALCSEHAVAGCEAVPD